MRCPYCVTEIHDEALVCPACQRDLYLFKPLLARIDELEQRVDAQDQLLAQLKSVAAPETASPEAALEAADEPEGTVRPSLATLAVCALAPLVLLVVAHGLIVIVYDLNTLYLRIVSLLIPLPFGLLLAMNQRRSLLVSVPLALALSGLAVVAMSWANALVDGTPVLPSGLREWREFLEYAASIAFSYATGIVIGGISRNRGRQAAQRSAGMSLAVARLISKGAAKTGQIQAAANKVHDFGNSLTAAATTAAALYTGLQGFLGK